jgi:prepilin-type N-terminal cleavage/methylation domain-containing protein
MGVSGAKYKAGVYSLITVRPGTFGSGNEVEGARYPSGRPSGFTLLEVLVALLILAISLSAVFQALSQSARISWKSDRYGEAARIAQNFLTDSLWVRVAVRDEERQGEVEGEEGWRYSVKVEPLAIEIIEIEEEEDPVEIPSMVSLRLCLTYGGGREGRPYCITRWYRTALIAGP